VVVVLAVMAMAGEARAEGPRIDMSRCEVFAAAEIERAVAAELVSVPAERAVHLEDVSVAVACPDAVTATISVAPGGFESTIDVGDLPADMRVRGVALAVAELVDAALDVAIAPAPTPPPPDPHGEGGVDAAHLAIAPPGDARRDVVRVAPGERVRWQERRALLGRERAGAHLGARLGARSFLDHAGPLTELAIEAARGPLAVDAFAATASARDELGSVSGLVGGAGLSVHLACGGGGGTWLCVGARAAAGVARITTEPVHPMVVAHDVTAPYFELGPRLEIRLEHRRWSGALGVGVAWSSGVAALAEDREVMKLGGPVVAASLGIGWGR
jgi:hypothetical protein